MSDDYITVLQAAGPINKKVRLVDGNIRKTAAGYITDAVALTVHVPGVQAMADIQNEIADDSSKVLIAGYIPDMVDKAVFAIRSQKMLAADGPHPDYPTYTRTKDNFANSSWWQIDRDYAPGCPQHLATLTEQGIHRRDRYAPTRLCQCRSSACCQYQWPRAAGR